jgi:AcrR family transcriptional regulator
MKETVKTRRDPEATRRRILDAATEEFAQGGLAGARVDAIAKRASTNERMLYYYFGSKEQLFICVLEEVYGGFAAVQKNARLASLAPEAALKAYARLIWDYYLRHPELIRLVNNENLHQGRYLRQSKIPANLNPLFGDLADILARGAEAGVFRRDVDLVRFYLSLSGLGYYAISNRFTLAGTFGRDFTDSEEHAQLVEQNLDMLLGYLRPLPG